MQEWRLLRNFDPDGILAKPKFTEVKAKTLFTSVNLPLSLCILILIYRSKCKNGVYFRNFDPDGILAMPEFTEVTGKTSITSVISIPTAFLPSQNHPSPHSNSSYCRV